MTFELKYFIEGGLSNFISLQSFVCKLHFDICVDGCYFYLLRARRHNVNNLMGLNVWVSDMGSIKFAQTVSR